MSGMNAEEKDRIVGECRELMSKAKYSDEKTEQFCQTVSDILQDIIDNSDEERQIRTKLTKRIDRIELRIEISGEKIDPFNDGKGAEGRRLQRAKNAVLFNPETSITDSYSSGWNRLTVKSPSRIANSKLMNNPMLLAMLLGAVAGIILKFLSEETRGVILDGISAPIMSTLVKLLMGFMGPVFFLFIILSVSSLGSMEELAKVGKVIFKRFIRVSLWVALLTIAVAFAFFPVFGSGNSAIDLPGIESALLGTLPTDFFTPFLQGQIPQVILLGIIFGVGLLVIGDSGKPVRNALLKVKEWVMGVMSLMMNVMPLIPFISTMMIVANGKASIFIQGWKYIAATYICYLLSLLIVFIFVSVRCKIGIRKLAAMLKKIAVTAFLTATPPATMQMTYEVSEKEMGIDKTFSDLWLSLSYNLLSPARTISLVLSVFFIADLTGMTLSISMMIIMLIVVVQVSLASSGTVPGATITLETLKLSTETVGLFSAFEAFTRNAGAAYDITYSMLEQLDASREAGKLNNKNTE